MKKQYVYKIFIYIFLVALVILAGHFHLDGLTGDHDHCPLCQLLTVGFTSFIVIILLPTSYFIANLLRIDLTTAPFSSYHQIALRAPPCHSGFPSIF
jgi:hypothetical protein